MFLNKLISFSHLTNFPSAFLTAASLPLSLPEPSQILSSGGNEKITNMSREFKPA